MEPPVTHSYSSAWIEKGTIIDVDLRAWTCTVRTEYDGKDIANLQIAAPYFHYHSGEGIYALPEVGAQALVCYPSDNDPPFIIGFVGVPEKEGQKAEEDPKLFIGDDTAEASEASPTVAGGNTSFASHRGGRRLLTPGSIALYGRDGNRVVLHRGGVLEIGSTAMCQRFYIPVMNMIRDVAENLRASTPGGELFWTVDRQETSGGTAAGTSYRLSLRDKVDDKKASVQLALGHVDSSSLYELVVDPTNVDPTAGTFSVTPKYRMRISASGNVIEDVQGSTTVTIKMGRTVEVTGLDKLTVRGARTVEISGAETKTIKGAQTVDVSGVSTTVVKGAYTLKAPSVNIGINATEPAVLGVQLTTWLLKNLINVMYLDPSKKAEMAAELAKIVSKTILVGP